MIILPARIFEVKLSEPLVIVFIEQKESETE